MAFVFRPPEVNEGKGARVTRIIGNQHIKSMDPFLMLDFAKVRLPVGFPDHPHRGFQTVSYTLEGSFYHEDFKGHRGKLGPGDLQWMTAGKGIIHSEVPASFQEDSVGFQLWVNLESKLKMIEPSYQEYSNDKIQIFKKDGVEVKIISGLWEGKKGPILARTPSYYFDVNLLPGGIFKLPISGLWNTLIFVYKGEATYMGKHYVDTLSCCSLNHSGKEEQFVHQFTSEKGGKFVLIGGKPLNQPIVQYGPFVMNTEEQIQQAFDDYQNKKNGFQQAVGWESKIKHLMKGKTIDQIY